MSLDYPVIFGSEWDYEFIDIFGCLCGGMIANPNKKLIRIRPELLWLVSYPLLFVIIWIYICLLNFQTSIVDLATNYFFFYFFPSCVLSWTVPACSPVWFPFVLCIESLFRFFPRLYLFPNRHFYLCVCLFTFNFSHILPTPSSWIVWVD